MTRDLLLAAALASALGVAWTWRDWAALSRLRLPDTDDVVRLQQIRDWLGGQRFADLTQHRLGAGVPMHWSRLADVGPAALIEALGPLLGRHGAELAAVIVWPLALFAAALALVARIARAAGGARLAGAATVVAAIAYPATTVFPPGRIDHHGLQVVLLLGATLAALGPATIERGIAAGGLAAASLVIGLETAPVLAAFGGMLLAEWVLGRADAERRLAGLCLGALAGLIAGRLIFATDAWAYPACDGFTVSAWRAAMILAGATTVLAALSSWLRSRRDRGIAVAAIAPPVLLAVLAFSPECLSPYGGVAPELRSWWLARVGEAQPLLLAPPATAIGYAGVMVAGIAATLWRLRRDRYRAWALLLALQLAAFAITIAQLRGAYAGAMLAAPALASVIVAARARGAPALAGAWLGSAGMLYPIAAEALTPARLEPPAATCSDPAVIARLAALPPGVVIAPIDAGAWALAATPHRLLAAPYHRDNAGNLAMLRFFEGDPANAPVIARAWRVRYVLLCDGDAAAFTPGAGSVALAIAAGRAPDWLRPLPARAAGVHLFEARP